jgi:putative transposon-encoded protein
LLLIAIKYLLNEYLVFSMEVRLEAHQVIEKVVKSSGNSGRVYVPKEWVGKRVKVLLLDPIVSAENLS